MQRVQPLASPIQIVALAQQQATPSEPAKLTGQGRGSDPERCAPV
jgi:hypothetical protein